MKKIIFYSFVLIVLIPIFLFVKSWRKGEKPSLISVEIIPKEEKFKLGKNFSLNFIVDLPWHLEEEKVDIILPKELIEYDDLIIQKKIILTGKRLKITAFLAAIKEIQINHFKIKLMTAKGKYELFAKVKLLFFEDFDELEFSPELVKNLEAEKKKEKIIIVKIIAIVLIIIVIFFILIFLLKRPKKLSTYKKAFLALESLKGKDLSDKDLSQKMEDILNLYLDRKFLISLVYVTYFDKIDIIYKQSIDIEIKDFLRDFYTDMEKVKFLPIASINIKEYLEKVYFMIEKIEKGKK